MPHTPMDLVKSSQRDSDHGDAFTPEWMVEAMLNLVQDESARIGARFLEPACGSGSGLAQVLRRKLASVDRKYGQSDLERRHFALLALMCLYGIEPRAQNVVECRAGLLRVLAGHLNLPMYHEVYRAASGVLTRNIVHGDALERCTQSTPRFTFAEWRYVGGGKFQRRDFRFNNLIVPAGFDAVGTPGDDDAAPEFTPVRTYPPMTVAELAAAAPGAGG